MYQHNPELTDWDGAGMPLTHSTIIDRTTDAIELLARTPSILGEVSLSDAEAAEMAKALQAQDDRNVSLIFRAAAARHTREMVDGVKDVVGSEYEAVMSLLRTYA